MRELCGGLGLELVVLTTPRRGFSRYALLTTRTMALLFRRRPDVLLIQNPSLILATLAVLLRSVLGFSVVVDAHNEAVEPYIHSSPIVRRLAHWVIKRSDLTIVTNRQLAHIVEAAAGRPFVLPDRIPDPPDGRVTAPLTSGFNLVLIATYAKDEPVAAVFEAVRDLPVQLYATGNPDKLDQSVRAGLPSNVTLTGFLPEQEYWALLRAADAIIDLTTMDNCLVCGAYEALALGKPMVLSGNAACEELFGVAALYVDNTSSSIRSAIQRLQMGEASREAIDERRRALMDQWTRSASVLGARLAS